MTPVLCRKYQTATHILFEDHFHLDNSIMGFLVLKKKKNNNKKGKQLASKADGVRYYTEDGIMEVSSLV